MIAEVILPKGGLEGTGKDVAELYDEEKQGMSCPPVFKCHCFCIYWGAQKERGRRRVEASGRVLS